MIKAILIIIFLLCALVGITEIIHEFLFFLIAPKGYCDYITVLLHNDTAIDSLNTAIYKFNLEGNHKFKKIIAIDCGIDAHERDLVLKITTANDNIVFGSIDALSQLYKNLKENNFGKCK